MIKRSYPITAKNFHILFQFLDSLGANTNGIVRNAGLSRSHIEKMKGDTKLLVSEYAALYEAAASAMQEERHIWPWSAGVGTDSFRFLCWGIISCRTLGEALQRAVKFYQIFHPVTGFKIEVNSDARDVFLKVCIDSDIEKTYYPYGNWANAETMVRISILRVWSSFMNWLIGQDIRLRAIKVSAPSVSEYYKMLISPQFNCNVEFSAEETLLSFDNAWLKYRLIQTDESLKDFVDNAIFELIVRYYQPTKVCDFVKKIIAKDLGEKIPTLTGMAKSLNMSCSSLRRKLSEEGTSYQKIKDEILCDMALMYLGDERMKIEDIAISLGFHEPGSFVRSFRRWTGKTPGEYRRSLRLLGSPPDRLIVS